MYMYKKVRKQKLGINIDHLLHVLRICKRKIEEKWGSNRRKFFGIFSLR